MNEKLKEVLLAAACAPSGDNLQPWKMSVNDNELRIYLNDEGIDSVFDHKHLASIFSIGTQLENISIEARYQGLQPEIHLFPEGGIQYIARIRFDEVDHDAGSNAEYVELHTAIKNRITNRKKYQLQSVTQTEKEVFQSIPGSLEIPARVRLIDDPDEIKKAAKLFAYATALTLKEKPLHNSLYKYLVWTKQTMSNVQSGLYIKTLELPWFNVVGMWLCQFWPIVWLGKWFGLGYVIEKTTENTFVRTGAFCAVSMPSSSPQDFLNGGRVFQRMWLEATARGLYMHPQFGFVDLELLFTDGKADIFSSREVDRMQNQLDDLKKTFRIAEDEQVVMYARIGRGEVPSATSERKSIERLLS